MLAFAVLAAACTSVPIPTQGPTVSPSAEASPGGDWPSFEPALVEQAVVRGLGMSCEPIAARIHCETVRPSGARFEAEVPDGTVSADRELSFAASGPIELESEARRLFAVVADAISGDSAQSSEWQDQIWAAFVEPQASASTLPNGVSWSASRQEAGGVLVWSLSLTW